MTNDVWKSETFASLATTTRVTRRRPTGTHRRVGVTDGRTDRRARLDSSIDRRRDERIDDDDDDDDDDERAAASCGKTRADADGDREEFTRGRRRGRSVRTLTTDET